MTASCLYTSIQHSIAYFYLDCQSEDYQCNTCMYDNPQLSIHCNGHITLPVRKPKHIYLHLPSPLRLMQNSKWNIVHSIPASDVLCKSFVSCTSLKFCTCLHLSTHSELWILLWLYMLWLLFNPSVLGRACLQVARDSSKGFVQLEKRFHIFTTVSECLQDFEHNSCCLCFL